MRWIISLRGTSGSGKSSTIYRLMERLETKPLDIDSKGRPNNYEMVLPNKELLYVIGRYTTVCGGCDAIGDDFEVMRRVDHYQQRGHVLFEGLLMSGYYGNLGKWSEQYKDRFIFAFLDTPFDLCVHRIRQRRLQRGNTKPLDPTNTEQKFKSIWACYKHLVHDYKRTCVILNNRRAHEQILELLKK